MLFLPESTDSLGGAAAKWPSILMPFTFPDWMAALLDGGPPNPTGKKLPVFPFCTTDVGNRNRPGITGARDPAIRQSHIDGVVRDSCCTAKVKKRTPKRSRLHSQMRRGM